MSLIPKAKHALNMTASHITDEASDTLVTWLIPGPSPTLQAHWKLTYWLPNYSNSNMDLLIEFQEENAFGNIFPGFCFHQIRNIYSSVK